MTDTETSITSSQILAAKQAITTIAKQAIYLATRGEDDGVDVAWENYPEIGDNDWQAVLEEVDRLAPPPDGFAAAYALIEARADHDA